MSLRSATPTSLPSGLGRGAPESGTSGKLMRHGQAVAGRRLLGTVLQSEALHSRGDAVNGATFVLALLGQQRHQPPAGAHIILLAGVALTIVALIGISRSRRHRDAAAAAEQPNSSERTLANTPSKEDE
jgi:high-affinity Fe2+/Pb2+ permease